jgi:ABC-type multidrug transport system fused ATPase/permease subunit
MFVLQLAVAVLAAVVVVLATQLRTSSALTGASLVTLMTFGDVLNYIIRWWTQIETSIGAVSRLKGFGEKVPSESLEGEDVVPDKGWPFRGGIEIDGVSASYLCVQPFLAAFDIVLTNPCQYYRESRPSLCWC